jgi:plastocyanin domain-containing protein
MSFASGASMNIFSIAKSVLPIVAVLAMACDKPAAAADSSGSTTAAATTPAVVAVTVGSDGFQPSTVSAAKGQKLTLTFTRTTDGTCAKAVSFPELGIKKDLPLNQPVSIDIPTSEARKLTFQCGMGMYKSSVVIN